MPGDRLTRVASVAAYQDVALNELRHSFDRIDLDLASVLSREQDVGTELDRATVEVDQLRARLAALGIQIAPAARPGDSAADSTASLDSRSAFEIAPSVVQRVAIREQNFERLATLAEAHLDLLGVDLARDPLSQVLPTSAIAASIRDFENQHGDISWTPSDWGVVASAGAIATLLDILLVKIPQDTNFLGEKQTGSPLTEWLKDDDRSGEIYKRFLRPLEKAAKVPYDASHTAATGGRVGGMRPKTHRLQSLGHDPLLGFVVGLADLMNATGTYIDRAGSLIQVASSMEPVDLVTAMVTQAKHLLTDFATTQGVPPPLFGLLQLGQIDSPFAVGPTGVKVPWTDVARFMYVNGYDLRHFFTMGIVPGTVELIIRAYWLLNAFATGKTVTDLKKEQVKLASMLLLGHSIATSGTLIKTGLIYGMNPLALNYPQLIATAKASVSWVTEASKREQTIETALDAEWRLILADLERNAI